MSRQLRICFVSPNGYPVLDGAKEISFVGGAEVQQALIARELVKRGHAVSMISHDFGQQEGVHRSGVNLLKMMPPKAGVPGVRFFHPLMTSLWGAMRRSGADVYYQRCAGGLTGMVVGIANALGKSSVFAGASDSDFDASLPRVGLIRDKMLFGYGVRNATRVVVQSERQLAMCKSAFDRQATQINSCYSYSGKPARSDGPIIWVGAIRSVKRAELFVELARRLSSYRFLLVGGAPQNDPVFIRVKERASGVTNLVLTGHVATDEVESYFDGASLLVNTSITEGFPNTFLQAWSRGVPTVSFFDSGAQEEGHKVGVVVEDLDSMADAVVELQQSRDAWVEHSRRSVRYFQQNFAIERSIDQYERLFAGIVPEVSQLAQKVK
ncbi:MAG: glycosyltransferase family 4 protein [Burkholderiales bacterium]|nr:glycosyltransferase family 4 protein [Burkholderiales bacterium]